MFLLLFFRNVKIYQGLMIPHALYTHENPNIFIAVYSQMGRTLEAYIVDKGLDLTTAEFKSQIIGATVMADVIRGFLTLRKWGYYSGAIHPKHIFFSQEYMNVHLYPVFCQRDEVVHEKPEDLFPYYSRTRENKICQNAEFHAMGFLYLQMRL